MMTVKNKKLRRFTLGIQLFAGIGLLTASYLTTDKGWSNDLVNAAIYKTQPTSKIEITTLTADLGC